MKTRHLNAWIFIFALHVTVDAADIVASSKRKQGDLTCIYWGDKISEKVQQITVESSDGNHSRILPASMAQSIDVKNVWSPDGQWLISQGDSHDGFRLIVAKDVFAESKPEAGILQITSAISKFHVDHEFVRWTKDAEFEFTLEHANIVIRCCFNIEQRKLMAPKKWKGHLAASFDGKSLDVAWEE